MTLISSSTGRGSCRLNTASRNPSAAAMISLSSCNFSSTPVSTGRDSSVAAEKATIPTPARRMPGSMVVAIPSSTCGTGGKSRAAAALMFVTERPQAMCNMVPPALSA